MLIPRRFIKQANTWGFKLNWLFLGNSQEEKSWTSTLATTAQPRETARVSWEGFSCFQPWAIRTGGFVVLWKLCPADHSPDFLFLAYAAYFLAACILDFQRALALFVITCLVILVLLHHFLKKFMGKKLTRTPRLFKNSRLRRWIKW